MKKFPTKVLSIGGIAGHGKDTLKDFIIENYGQDNDFIQIRMANGLKNIASYLMPREKSAKMGYESTYEAMEDLKNNHPNEKIIGGFNAREVQQRLGTEVLRGFIEEMNIIIECSKIANYKGENPVFYSADIRFRNELEFMVNLSKDPVDFARYFIDKHRDEFSFDENDIIDKMAEVLGEEVRTVPEFDEMKEHIAGIVQDIKNTPKPNKEHTIESLTEIDFKSKTKEEAFKYGYINIFRPILSDEFIQENEGKIVPSAIIRREIADYTELSIDNIYDIQHYYRVSGIDFSVDNISKYGYLRASIAHISERDLDDHKPQPLVSEPMHRTDLKPKIFDLVGGGIDEVIKNKMKVAVNSNKLKK